jgi:hypothetical protein
MALDHLQGGFALPDARAIAVSGKCWHGDKQPYQQSNDTPHLSLRHLLGR